ncbi:hypothetical protein ACFL5F_00770 [Planctomycetota bacterium]
MTDSLNGNAIYTRYDHFINGVRQWSTDISCNYLLGIGNGLTGMVEVLALRHRFVRDILAVSHHSRQGPDR